MSDDNAHLYVLWILKYTFVDAIDEYTVGGLHSWPASNARHSALHSWPASNARHSALHCLTMRSKHHAPAFAKTPLTVSL
jgi:hypothetical protein